MLLQNNLMSNLAVVYFISFFLSLSLSFLRVLYKQTKQNKLTNNFRIYICIISAKERIEQELGLLHVRKQAITINNSNSSDAVTHKVKKKTTMKRGANARQQKKIARALLVADKEETKLEKQAEKDEKKKLRKNIWS